MPSFAYDEIGVGYRSHRRSDPRIAAQISAALGGATRICNVGAGAGSYEPRTRGCVAVEPSRTMIAQRGAGRAPAVQAVAEALPFADDSFEAAMASLTVHHWQDIEAGLAEMRRVAPRQVVFGFDPAFEPVFWIEKYFPLALVIEDERAPSVPRVAKALAASRVEEVLVPWDCSDGFMCAYWRRPERYLDPAVRSSISTLARLSEEQLRPGLEQLEADLRSRRWHREHEDLLEREEMDWGYRLFIAEAGVPATKGAA